MSLRDDDDELGESLSGQDYIDNPNKRLEQKEKKQKKELKKLKTQSELQQLKKQQEQEQKNQKETFGTKTRDEEIQEQVQEPSDDPNPDTLIEEGKRQEAVDDQTQYEQGQQTLG